MTICIRPLIVLFGDSLTELAFGEEVGSSSVGWASLLASAYSRHADVLNRGFRGALQYGSRALVSCRGCLSNNNKAKGVIVMAKHSFVLSFFGANNCMLPGEMRHKPIEEFGDNM
jgi:hypothetical protein